MITKHHFSNSRSKFESFFSYLELFIKIQFLKRFNVKDFLDISQAKPNKIAATPSICQFVCLSSPLLSILYLSLSHTHTISLLFFYTHSSFFLRAFSLCMYECMYVHIYLCMYVFLVKSRGRLLTG